MERLAPPQAFYQPSGRIPAPTVLALIASFLCAILAALPYAWLTLRASWYLSPFVAWLFALWLAFVVRMACQLAKVRNPGLMSQFGLAVGVVAWAAQWIFWIVFAAYDNVRSMPGLLTDPKAFREGLGLAIGLTEWSGHERHFLLRLASWLAEFSVLLAIPARAGFERAGRPFCEVEQRWATVHRLSHNFAGDILPGARAHFVDHPVQLLKALTPSPSARPACFARVTLFRGRKAAYISVDIHKTTFDGPGMMSKEHELVRHLRVPARETEAFLRRWSRNPERLPKPAARGAERASRRKPGKQG